MISTIRRHVLVTAMIPVLVALVSAAASASQYANGGAGGGGGQGLPWETPLQNISDALTGPTAKYISIIAIFVAGIALIFGEDLGQFARRVLMIVIAIAFLLGASSFILPLTTGAHF
ncbi:MAG: TrbC/VirB2 family protein [Candidatus Eremiobacteraeota bacterium]|nr:TrbC/VirB2 family protein [Candidatus Eremiobacteraeota bacterium]